MWATIVTEGNLKQERRARKNKETIIVGAGNKQIWMTDDEYIEFSGSYIGHQNDVRKQVANDELTTSELTRMLR